MTAAREARVLEVLARRQPDLTVLMDQVNKPHNLSAILRSCDAVGIQEAHAVAADGYPITFSDTAASADKWVPLRVHASVEAAIAALRGRGYQLVATHLSQRAVDYREVDYSRPTCVILGAERWGVSAGAAEAADANIVVPMRGMVQSLNVSVAAAVILFEAARQREAAGLYATPRLSDDERERLAFEWLYPTEAGRFRERGEPYPAHPELRQLPQPPLPEPTTPAEALARLKARLSARAEARAFGPNAAEDR